MRKPSLKLKEAKEGEKGNDPEKATRKTSKLSSISNVSISLKKHTRSCESRKSMKKPEENLKHYLYRNR